MSNKFPVVQEAPFFPLKIKFKLQLELYDITLG